MQFCSLRPNFINLFTTLTLVFLRSWPLRASAWPQGTTAKGSSTHSPDGDRNYFSSYAIDEDVASFWNDDTNGIQPDTLTIEVSSPISLDGIILLSSTDGWVLSYTVETLHGSNWTVDATVIDNNDSALQYVPFASSVNNVTQLRIVVTEVQTIRDKYTRINEVYPIMAAANPSNTTSTSKPTPESSNALEFPPTDQPHCHKELHTTAILGGLLGFVILVLSVATLLLVRKLRKSSAYVSQPIGFSPMGLAEASIVPTELSSQNGRILYQKPELDSRVTYQNPELDSRVPYQNPELDSRIPYQNPELDSR